MITPKLNLNSKKITPIRSLRHVRHAFLKTDSSLPRKAIEATKELINKTIAKELDVNTFSSSNTIRIADLGCSVGTNTLLAVKNIINAVQHKFQSQGNGTKLPEFQVFFNDQASNDLNHLFTSLPSEMQYLAAGVLGSFYRRLFPKNSLHFIHSSTAAHWLSRVPEEVEDKSSPAWNKGKVHYSNSRAEVIKAFEAQFAKDMDNFLKIRAQEIVHGELMVLILRGSLNGAPHANDYINKVYELLESSLTPMITSTKSTNSWSLPS
ncbi:hypothetical protein TIFTF001_015530 [Ficus carica]|uniref:Uncharacterized protein n=1 Tax=Ficus carica TaxID=3494 RepID=A0AA88D6L8_FICCA|nr:hypothetical protein TIFTF001_015530 [Ficus carica]